MGLRPEYESVSAALLHRNSLPTLDAAIQKILFEEKRLGIVSLCPLMSLLQPPIHDMLMSLLFAKIVNFTVISLLIVLLLSAGIATNEVISWTIVPLVHPVLLVSHINPSPPLNTVLHLLLLLLPHLIS